MKESDQFYNTSELMSTSRKGYYQEKIDYFIAELKRSQKSKKRILDIACNDGELTEKYSAFGETMGIDINKKAIAVCKKRGLHCVYADLSEIIISHKNYFDYVIAGDIIEHIFDTDEFLLNIKAVLRQDGKLLLTTPNIASFGRRLMLGLGMNPFVEYSTKLPSIEFNVGHIRYYTKENLRRQLRATGFTHIDIQGDKINLLPGISIPYSLAKSFPTFARNLMATAQKNSL
jgi:2-polyprenyl-3-methyl-5-hydroxy-6-metoxy-1,4-benzoquinol methylase